MPVEGSAPQHSSAPGNAEQNRFAAALRLQLLLLPPVRPFAVILLGSSGLCSDLCSLGKGLLVLLPAAPRSKAGASLLVTFPILSTEWTDCALQSSQMHNAVTNLSSTRQRTSDKRYSVTNVWVEEDTLAFAAPCAA